MYESMEMPFHTKRARETLADTVTEAMNSAIDQVDGNKTDSFVSGAARHTLERVEW